MNTKDWVCDIDLARELKLVGVKQNSYFYYVNDELYSDSEWCHRIGRVNSYADISICSAFTASEIRQLIPCQYQIIKHGHCYVGYIMSWPKPGCVSGEVMKNSGIIDAKEANAYALLLLHLIHKGILKRYGY
jgi:hypothetical protein